MTGNKFYDWPDSPFDDDEDDDDDLVKE